MFEKNVSSQASELLKSGVEILDGFLRKHGFEFLANATGVGSGGAFVSGEALPGRPKIGVALPAFPGARDLPGGTS
jgi:hypothetical protein